MPDSLLHANDTTTRIRFPGPGTFAVDTSGNERLRITSSGIIGAGGIPIAASASNGVGNAGTFQFYHVNTSGNNAAAGKIQSIATGAFNGSTSTWDADLVFSSVLNSTETERLRIFSNGLVNIGAGSSTSGLSPLLHLHKNASNSSAYFHITNNDTGITNNDGFLLGINPSGDCLVFNKDSTPIRFATAGIERLRITSGGNALFGGTAVSQTNRQLALGSNAEANFAIETHNNAFSESSNIRFYKSRGTAASPTAVADNHYISQLMFYGHDGTDYANTVGYMRVLVDGTVASNQVPGQIQLGVNDGSTATTAMTIHKTGSVLFSGLTAKNDPRNAKGITIKSSSGGAGISIQNFGANGSHNWRIRPDDLTAWGTLEFSVSPTSNSATDWPDATSDVVLTLQPNKDVKVNNGNLVIGTAGKGVQFSPFDESVSNPGSDSNTLDDYEEGTYVPTTNTNLTLQSSYDVFAYIKIGRCCTVRGLFYPNNNPSGNYAMTFSLPFQAYNYTQIAGAGGSGVMYRYISGATAGVAVYVEDGTTTAKFYKNGSGNSGWSPVYNTDWNSAMEIYVDFTYFTV
tara:strand:+ start:145 stop:1863 length:1719 start_codon:yes stop_codon:yes gene_type:complete